VAEGSDSIEGGVKEPKFRFKVMIFPAHTSDIDPSLQILQRKQMSASGGKAAVTRTPSDVAV
jgi:hypothetical protein